MRSVYRFYSSQFFSMAQWWVMFATDPKHRFTFGVLFALLLAFGTGIYVGTTAFPFVGAQESSAQPAEVDFAPLYKAWNILEEHYVAATTTDGVTREEMVWGAIQGLARSYGDDYTVFFPPAEKEIFESEVRGDFEGVGMEIGVRDDVLTVIAPLKDTPAYRAGIKTNDRILQIDGESTDGLTTELAVKKIRGERGTPVTFLIARGSEMPFEITVVRDTIVLPTIQTELTPEGVFVIELYSFNALAPQLFRGALQQFADSGTNKLLIDLRGNPGGYLEVAVDIASWFLPVGRSIVVEDYNDETRNNVHRSRGYDVFSDQLQLAILINEGSASASEILAGALREHGKATLIGSTSFGKGSVQQVFPVTDTTALKVTVARWLTPQGNSISDGGITPDIEVEVTDEDIEAGRDPQRVRAIQFLLEGN